MNYIYEAEGKTRAEAEQIALSALGLKEEDVTFEAVSAGKSFLGIVNRKPTVVRLFAKNVPIETVIKGTVITLIRKMGLTVENVGVHIEEESFVVSIDSEDSAILIGKQGRTLDSLQFLTNCMVDSRIRNNRRVVLDVAEYRERRKQRLTKLAKAVADRVARTSQSVLLEWMNPYERRIVHLALEPDERVTTRSDGNGVYKRVRVLPQKGRPGSGPQDRQDRPDRQDRERNFNRAPREEEEEDQDFNRKDAFDDQ
ncbi:MAG TPA: RNA-binding cell elongation regulator Jag/EloR [Leptospiraceae bacterium]|jgi:spoIIIJ-associated protein|nr:protein jag [Leptospirales bacterium]HMU84963.1 RNA-binding cell elongation regulator Jag/EloR [Leptospiraceae bacterium]HMW58303.1 RNA-binding cell elongation regulator Jag/EloR [Leptospiraceae bacterium]HMX54960.1 RNA-binding cell elongation regulator Jag/EloR [Leptospiraceae bacterium]HMY44041.1 RNA-binding cell elongation regulator Jag/EloR [Leptospiraceae bacterium]